MSEPQTLSRIIRFTPVGSAVFVSAVLVCLNPLPCSPAYLARSSKCSQGEGWTTSPLAVQRVAEIQVTAVVPLLSMAFSLQLWL